MNSLTALTNVFQRQASTYHPKTVRETHNISTSEVKTGVQLEAGGRKNAEKLLSEGTIWKQHESGRPAYRGRRTRGTDEADKVLNGKNRGREEK